MFFYLFIYLLILKYKVNFFGNLKITLICRIKFNNYFIHL